MLIVTSAPLIGGFFALSVVNQAVRKMPCVPITKPLDDEDRLLTMTKIGASLWNSMCVFFWGGSQWF